MKIGVNALFLQTPASGSGQYLIHLLKALAEVDQQNEYILLGARPIAESHNEQEAHQAEYSRGRACPYPASFRPSSASLRPYPATLRPSSASLCLPWERLPYQVSPVPTL